MIRSPRTVFGPLALASLLALTSCSKDSNSPTSPGGTTRELNSSDLAQGGSYAHTFANAGTYPYHCARHTSMTGTVTISNGGADSALVHITGFAFAPQSAPAVKPGGTVRWVNDDSALHTVTSD